MLKQRVITATVLLALLLPSLLASSAWPFALLSVVMIGAAGWEWGRLNGVPRLAVAMAAVLVVACFAAWWSMALVSVPPVLWAAATVVWVLGGALAIRGGPAGWGKVSVVMRCVLGLVALAIAWLAMNVAKLAGVNFLLSIAGLVWAADIAAYFGGRAFGKRKLAPAISPGKSWEGVWSGMAGVFVVAVVWIAADRSFQPTSASVYSLLLARFGPIGLAASLLLLSAMSVAGDLVESLVKRSAGAKDSSRLLPGHGGVLDRVDALLPVFPIALALCTL
jgi:phosphatidate cytidylyltransferase